MESKSECPTAILVDLSEPTITESPKTPRRATLSRKCKTLCTPKESNNKNNTTVKSTKGTEQQNILMSLENVLPSNQDILADAGKEPEEMTRKDATEECFLLEQETFDFDLSLSLESGSQGENDDDDDGEVFFGKMTFKEKCIAKAIQPDLPGEHSPLTRSEMLLLEKEANHIAAIVKAKGTPLKGSHFVLNSESESDSPDFLKQLSSKRRLDMSDDKSEKPISKMMMLSPEKEAINTGEKMESPKQQAIVEPTSLSPAKRKPRLIGLQRSSSVRLPRTKALESVTSRFRSPKQFSGLPPPSIQTRQCLAEDKKENRFPMPSKDKSTKHGIDSSLNSSTQEEKKGPGLQRRGSLRAPGTVTSLSKIATVKNDSNQNQPVTSSLTRKGSMLKGSITRPDFLKSGRSLQKPLVVNNGKMPSRCIPSGPLKAIKPVESLVQKSMSSVTSSGISRTLQGGVTSKQHLAAETQEQSSSKKSAQPRAAGIPKPKFGLTPRKNSISASYRPSPTRSSSLSSTRSLSSTTSTGSNLDSSMTSDVSFSQSRDSITSTSSRTRRSLVTPRKPPDRRSVFSPGTPLASKLRPIKLN